MVDFELDSGLTGRALTMAALCVAELACSEHSRVILMVQEAPHCLTESDSWSLVHGRQFQESIVDFGQGRGAK